MKPRERLLLTAFVWAVLLLCLIGIASSISKGFRQLHMARAEVLTQDRIIAQKNDIEKRLETARNSIDTNKTLGALQLSSTIDSLARDASLSANIASPVSKESSIFNTYSVRISCRNAPMENLLNFARSVRAKAPYLAIRRFKISADTHNPAQLSAELEIESFELNQTLSR